MFEWSRCDRSLSEVAMAKKQGKSQGSMNDNAGSADRDAVALLEAQHREVERLFQGIPDLEAQDLKRAVTQLVDKLTIHSAIEERHFYPGVRTSDTEDLLDESFQDHQEIKEVCLFLLDQDPSDESYQEKVEELQGLVEEHVTIEESELFPMVRDLIDAADLQTLAEQMIATASELEQEGNSRQTLTSDLGARA
jgi:hemerythrin superfamily protein